MTIKSLTHHYRRMAKQHHPDRGGGHDAFICLNHAFEDVLRRIKAGGKPPPYRARRN